MQNSKLISGQSNVELAKLISQQLKTTLMSIEFVNFANTEINTKITDVVRGFDVYIIQTGAPYDGRSINDHLIELIGLIDACTRAGSKSVNIVMPCYAYARSDKKDTSRVPIMASALARIYTTMGIKRLICMDLHAAQIQGFFQTMPVDNLYAMNLHIKNLQNTIFKDLTQEQINDQFILASPDAGGVRRIESYAEKLKLRHLIMHKHRNYNLPGVVMNTILIGESGIIKNKCIIIIDDIIDTCGTMVSAANELKQYGAKSVILIATHGVLSDKAIERINNCDMIQSVIVTNTIAQENNLKYTNKLVVIDVSELFANFIYRIQEYDTISVSEFF